MKLGVILRAGDDGVDFRGLGGGDEGVMKGNFRWGEPGDLALWR